MLEAVIIVLVFGLNWNQEKEIDVGDRKCSPLEFYLHTTPCLFRYVCYSMMSIASLGQS